MTQEEYEFILQVLQQMSDNVSQLDRTIEENREVIAKVQSAYVALQAIYSNSVNQKNAINYLSNELESKKKEIYKLKAYVHKKLDEELKLFNPYDEEVD